MDRQQQQGKLCHPQEIKDKSTAGRLRGVIISFHSVLQQMSSKWRKSSTVNQDAEGGQSIQNIYLVHLDKYQCPAEAFLLLTRTLLAKEERAFSANRALQHLSYDIQSSEAEVTPATLLTSQSVLQKRDLQRSQGLLATKTGGPGTKTTSARCRQSRTICVLSHFTF